MVWVRLFPNLKTEYISKSGKKLPVTLDAHISNILAWRSNELFPVKHNLDHRKLYNIDVTIKDSRWDSERGLVVDVDSSDARITESIKRGLLRPSPEFAVNPKDIINGEIRDYIPVGIGWMKSGNQLDADAGPMSEPEQNAIDMIGGNMEGNDNEGSENIPEQIEKEIKELESKLKDKDDADVKKQINELKEKLEKSKKDTTDKDNKDKDKEGDTSGKEGNNDKENNENKEEVTVEMLKKQLEEMKKEYDQKLASALEGNSEKENELKELLLSDVPDELKEVWKDEDVKTIRVLKATMNVITGKNTEGIQKELEELKKNMTSSPPASGFDPSSGNKIEITWEEKAIAGKYLGGYMLTVDEEKKLPDVQKKWSLVYGEELKK